MAIEATHHATTSRRFEFTTASREISLDTRTSHVRHGVIVADGLIEALKEVIRSHPEERGPWSAQVRGSGRVLTYISEDARREIEAHSSPENAKSLVKIS